MILVVDDEPSVLAFLSLCIRRMGYTPVESHNAMHALKKWDHSGPFKLLIADILMPGITGIQLAETIQKKDPHLPILFLSAYPKQPKEVSDWIERGHAQFLAKPFSLDALQMKIGALIGPSEWPLPSDRNPSF